MAQWGNTDVASNTSLQWLQQLQVTPNTANRTAAFGNTSAWYANSKGVAGIFGVDTTEAGVNGGPLITAKLYTNGSGYAANAAVTITIINGGSGATVNAHANTTGRIDLLNVQVAGTGFKVNPTITVAAPDLVIFNGNTSVVANTIAITAANSLFLVGDIITYAGNTSSTPGGLTDQSRYYISFSNTTVIALSATSGGANLAITSAPYASAIAGGATVRGETATGYVAVGGGRNKGVTAGWNLRTAGTGGRAGRVQNECLVAMRSIVSDASDDTVFPDA